MQGIFNLRGQRAAVVGGASGIGRSCAEFLANHGAKVTILDINVDDAMKASAQIPDATVEALDVTDGMQVDAVFSRLDGLKILVNSAGIAKRHAAMDHPDSDWELVTSVNMTGTFRCARAAARQMIKANSGGSIINVASIMGLSGGGIYPNISYQTTKGAVVNMTRALAVEWAPQRIRVNAVAPTYVRTKFIEPLLSQPELMARIEAMTPLGCIAEPADVAGAVLFLASDAAKMVTGHTLPVDGGFLSQ